MGEKKSLGVNKTNNSVTSIPNNNGKQLTLHTKKLTKGQAAANWLAKWAGSWSFIGLFALFLFVWMFLNTYMFIFGQWDNYPFILLNLVLSCIAALQAPVILMSQNRTTERDRVKAERDYYINRKSEREISKVQEDLDEIKKLLYKVIHK